MLKKKDDNENDEKEISISFNNLENSCVKEAFIEIDDCSYFSTHFSFEEISNNDNNNNNDNDSNNDVSSINNNINIIEKYNNNNNYIEFEEKKLENFLQKKRKII